MNCTCNAYPFPHRPLGGACEAAAIWESVAEEGAACEGCPFNTVSVESSEFWGAVRWDSRRECQAVSARQCPGVSERLSREVAA